MRFLQVSFSLLLSCMIGYSNPSALAIVIIGALLPDADSNIRAYSEGVQEKGPTHSILFAVLFFGLSVFYRPLFFIGIGILGHIVIELLSKQVALQLLWPLPIKIHIPVLNQYKSSITILSVVILALLFVFFIDFYTVIDIFITYLVWIRDFLLWVVDKARYIFFRLTMEF